jgi:hypothetical protein
MPTATVGVASPCAPRPAVRLLTLRSGPGQLDVTIQGGLSGFSRIDVGGGRNIENATVDILGGPTRITSATTHTLPSGTSQIVVRVSRIDPARPVLVPLTVYDGCGPWSTFVGAGAGAF